MPMWKTSDMIARIIKDLPVEVRVGYQGSEYFTERLIIEVDGDETNHLSLCACSQPYYKKELPILDEGKETEVELDTIILMDDYSDYVQITEPAIARVYGEIYARMLEDGWIVVPNEDCVS